MKVKAKHKFTSVVDGHVYYLEAGQVIEYPDGARWLEAGLVVPVRSLKVEKAVTEPEETTNFDDYEATPAAEELAKEHDIDLNILRGTGKDGKILKADVESQLD